jgi:hypothetical protein
VAEGLTRVFKLLAPIIAMGGARALRGGARARIIILLGIVPDDLII